MPLFAAGFVVAGGLLAPSTASAQPVSFTDPNLEQAVRDQLGIPSGTITQSNMLGLTNLYAAFRGITNLAGLDTASNLLTLDITVNLLTNVPALAGLTKLTELHIGGNHLPNCSALAGLTNLVLLDLNGNALTNVAPLASLRKLTQLWFPWNRVTDVSPVAGLTNLVLLDIGGNRGPLDSSITNVSVVSGLKHLQWLSVYFLRVSDLTPVGGLTTLTNLDIGWNIPPPANLGVLNGLTNIVLMHANNAGISNIAFTAFMPRLQELDLGNDNVRDISLLSGRSLVALWAYNDPVLTNASVVTTLHQLQRLSLGGDGLTNIPPLGGLTNLQELWVDNNPNLRDVTPLVGLTNVWHLNVNNDAFTNFSAIATMYQLTYFEMNSLVLPQDISFVSRLTNLYTLDLGNDHVGSLTIVTNLPQLNYLYAYGNYLTDLSAAQSLPYLYYVDARANLIDTNPAAAGWNSITNLQSYYTQVDFDPQNLSPTLTIWDQPEDDCVAVHGTAYFAVAASSTYDTPTFQWQFNGLDLPGQTSDVLLLTDVQSNQAGLYRLVILDGQGGVASAPASLFVGDPNCGRTVTIVQQPVNLVAAPGEDVYFEVEATTTLTNLYYQWTYYGTNIAWTNFSGDTSDELALYTVDPTASGFYQVQVWDDSSNVVASTAVELRVVDQIVFVDPALSNQVASSLGIAPGMPIYLSDLDTLGYLYAGYSGITNISGLEYARNLYGLDLSGNLIADPTPIGWLWTLGNLSLDGCGLQDASFVSTLTNLNFLNLNNNQIHSVPDMHNLAVNLGWLGIDRNGPLINLPRLAVLTNLYNLTLHDDALPDIQFTAGMTLLQSLDVGADYLDDGNRSFIRDVSPLANKTLMYWLSLSFNQATNVPVVGALTNLAQLWISSNHFTSLSFISNMPNLNVLAINYSGVTNLSPVAGHAPMGYLDVGYIATSNLTAVSGLVNLNTLWAGGNHAGTLAPVAPLLSLQVLGYDHDNVGDLSPLTNLTSLSYLNLEYNNVTNISVISNRSRMDSLYLTGNQVHDLAPLAGYTNLHWLSLSANGFTNVSGLSGDFSLLWLVMQSNYVQNIAALAGSTNLIYALDLSGNQITNLSPVTNLHALTWLNALGNKLTTLPSLTGLSSVGTIDCSFNQLTEISGVSGLPTVNWLSFANNQLASAAVTNCPLLATLDFANNQLTNLTLANLPNLHWLGLRNNKFTVAPTINGFPNLDTIELTTNLLTDISGLAGATGLHYLYLGANNLLDIHSLTNLTTLLYTDVTFNRLDLNSPAVQDVLIALQNQHTGVSYIPQQSITVTPLVLGLPSKIGAGQFRFSIQSSNGAIVQIWESTNLAPANWLSLGFVTNLSGTTNFTDVTATNRNRYYRGQQL